MYTVYRLENVVTKKNYIGVTSREPKRRWGGEYRGKMKEAIATYPFDLCWKKHIEFQTPNKEQALELEAELMKWYDSVENGYNTSSYSSHSCKHSKETKRKISEALSGEKSPNFGKHFSEEHRKNISEAQTGEKNSMFGKHHSEETRNKISQSKGVNGILQFSKDGEFIAEYPSIKEAERTTGCYHICECCKGKRKSARGFIWRYREI